MIFEAKVGEIYVDGRVIDELKISLSTEYSKLFNIVVLYEVDRDYFVSIGNSTFQSELGLFFP